MRQIVFILLGACLPLMVFSQPERRRVQVQQAQKSNANNVTMRAQISFPTEAKMPEDVVWRRDIYRELSLTEEANAGLYYPVEPVGSQMNLFTYIFKLFMHGNIDVYEYRLDGNESFNDSSKVKRRAFLDNYHIYYEKTSKGVHIDDSDIPSKEVTAYYLKESAYYDQSTATFHRKVLALCPIMKREDDFGDGATAYPLFWVKYDDLAPFLAKQVIMTSNLNNAATMSIDDFFTMNKYKGKIYKTTNMLGETLAQYCHGDTAKISAEQKKIENELAAFEKNLWGDQARKDSLDSIAKATVGKKKVKAARSRRSSAGASVRTRRTKSSSSSSANSPARVTVRRQRH
ncbi:MAG: gliding motility protein GldN [Prevotella sp.]|nr:gliding motility protein GldN [Prevotella sp.]MCI2079600.1 gliding motility protein GldN [Prevotella sp.]MCI2101413.1 gliding motility protein GldN [Prevotella sp.]